MATKFLKVLFKSADLRLFDMDKHSNN